MYILYNIAVVLVIIDALNWGLVSLFKFDLVATLLTGNGAFGSINGLSRLIYGLVGLSALYIAAQYFLDFM